jgi:hypothetical protein
LEGGPPSFPHSSTSCVVLRIPSCPCSLLLQDWHLLRCVVRTLRIRSKWSHVTVLQPPTKSPWLGLGVSRVRSPLLAASRLIPVRQGTEMFQFPHCPSHALWIQAWIRGHAATWVAPFGDVWFIAWSQLPRHISVRTPSFIGPGRRGIPLVPYFASSTLFGKLGKIEVMETYDGSINQRMHQCLGAVLFLYISYVVVHVQTRCFRRAKKIIAYPLRFVKGYPIGHDPPR